MTELDILNQAKSYINQLANGIDPTTQCEIPRYEVIHNKRISKCLFYVEGVLQQIIANGGIIPASSPTRADSKKPCVLSTDQTERFEFSNSPITINELNKKIQSIAPKENFTGFTKNLIGWLESIKLLEHGLKDKNNLYHPTKVGATIGIILDKLQGQYINDQAILFNEKAQRFIIEYINDILAYNTNPKATDEEPLNHGMPWDNAQTQKLIKLFRIGFGIEEISKLLKRSERSIQMQIERYNLDYENTGDTVTVQPSQGSSGDPAYATPEKSEDEKPPKKTCQTCRFAKSGECFPRKEICDDYEPSFKVSEDERSSWPTMGDASRFRERGYYK